LAPHCLPNADLRIHPEFLARLPARQVRLEMPGRWGRAFVAIEIEIEIVTSEKCEHSQDVKLRTPQRKPRLAAVTVCPVQY
jgi:hypothetical protein